MLVKVVNFQELNWGAICRIYEEGFYLRGKAAYPRMPENEQILRAQEDTYHYLRDEFYTTDGAYYAFWVEENNWVSALRMRYYRDGILLDALETAPDCRNCGYARRLLQEVLSQLSPHTKVYSRILRRNKASVHLHLQCGFKKVKPYAVFLDGTFRMDADTYLYEN